MAYMPRAGGVSKGGWRETERDGLWSFQRTAGTLSEGLSARMSAWSQVVMVRCMILDSVHGLSLMPVLGCAIAGTEWNTAIALPDANTHTHSTSRQCHAASAGIGGARSGWSPPGRSTPPEDGRRAWLGWDAPEGDRDVKQRLGRRGAGLQGGEELASDRDVASAEVRVRLVAIGRLTHELVHAGGRTHGAVAHVQRQLSRDTQVPSLRRCRQGRRPHRTG